MIVSLVQDATRYRIPLLIAGAAVAATLLALLVWQARRLLRRIPAGTPWFYYLASTGGLAVSLNTSWRFFGQRLGITGAEQVIMFSVVELALVACALGMRVNVRRVDSVTGRPGAAGAPRIVAWVLCGLSAYAALLLSGPIEGIARVALGPTLSLVMLHLALGIEIRNHTTTRTGTWARVGRELRERVLSRLGLADDDRDASTRTRERAARRVARLALGEQTSLRTARLSRALRASNVAHDERIQQRMLAELAVLRHAGELATLPLPSPWASAVGATAIMPSVPVPAAVSPSVTAGPKINGERPRQRERQVERAADPEPAAGEDSYANGMLDGVLLAAHTSPEWASETSKEAAIDLADELLPNRTPSALVAALSQIGVTVGESSVRRRRAQRPDPAEPLSEQEHAR
jgi:hypothetical protein